MLAIPLILGLGLAGARPSAAWAAAAPALLVFLAHHALVPVLRRRLDARPAPEGWVRSRIVWGCVYLAGAIAMFCSAVALAPASHRGWLLVLSALAALGGAVYSGASAFGSARLAAIELTGMAALSLAAPIMALCAGRPIDSALPAASALAFSYSASALSFVRAYTRLDRARILAPASCIAAHVVLAGGLGLMVWSGWLSPWLLAAFAPVAARTAWGLLRPPRDLRQLGLREVWVAASFTIIATVLLSAG